MDTWLKQAFEERTPLAKALFAQILPKLLEVAKESEHVIKLKIEGRSFDPMGETGPTFPCIFMTAGERPVVEMWWISSEATGVATIIQKTTREQYTKKVLPLSDLDERYLRSLLAQLVEKAQQTAQRVQFDGSLASHPSEEDLGNRTRHVVKRSLVCAGIGFGVTATAIGLFVVVATTGIRAAYSAISLIAFCSCVIAPVLHLWGLVIGAKGLSWTGEGNSRPVLAVAINLMLLAANVLIAVVAVYLVRIGNKPVGW